jgi:hypothetical protein
MRFKISGRYWDFDLDLFWQVAGPLNTKIQEFLAYPNAEMALNLDFPDSIEQLLGVALATAQVYIVSVSRYHQVSKERTLDLGPKVRSGHAIARLIHHGANFWKHSDEWDWTCLDKRAKQILEVFHDIGISETEATLFDLVCGITDAETVDLGALRPLLEQWRTAVEQSFPDQFGDATYSSPVSRDTGQARSTRVQSRATPVPS